MKLSDINQELTEKPVGMLKRGLTKLKKHTPFNADARAEAEGQDEVEAAANAVNTAFRKWLGRQSQLKDKNAIPHTLLVDFFKSINMGKTGEDVINATDAVKGATKVTPPSEDEPAQDEPAQTQPKTQNVPGYGEVSINAESLEARLAGILNEAEESEGVAYFTKDEVGQLILKVVGKIQSTNSDGLDDWLRAKGVTQEQPSVADQAETISDEDFEIVRQEIDDLVNQIADVSVGEVETARAKKALRQKIEQLKDQTFDQLTR